MLFLVLVCLCLRLSLRLFTRFKALLKRKAELLRQESESASAHDSAGAAEPSAIATVASIRLNAPSWTGVARVLLGMQSTLHFCLW